MKKEYIAPTIKVRKIHCSHMLCGSMLGITREEVNDEATENLYGTEYNKEAW